MIYDFPTGKPTIAIVSLGGYDGTNAAQTGVKTLQQILTDAGLA